MNSSSGNNTAGNSSSGNSPPGDAMVLLSSVMAIQLSQDMTAEQIALLASFFSTLSSNLGLIALQKSKLASNNGTFLDFGRSGDVPDLTTLLHGGL